MTTKFEIVTKYEGKIELPIRATKYSAGYDIAAAENKVIQPWHVCINGLMAFKDTYKKDQDIFSLGDVGTIVKSTGITPVLISTGLKCKLAEDEYLTIVSRSSTPMKYWLIVPNSIGIIDSDYYNNQKNEGEIFIQLINMSPFPIEVQKGDILVQGIIHKFHADGTETKNDVRVGGFGSTNG